MPTAEKGARLVVPDREVTVPMLRILPRIDERSLGRPLFDMDRPLVHLADDADITIGSLANGTMDGNASVCFCFVLPDGVQVFAETTFRLFFHAAQIIVAAHADEAFKLMHHGP